MCKSAKNVILLLIRMDQKFEGRISTTLRMEKCIFDIAVLEKQ